MTHKELVDLAARWLRGTRKCSLVATERRDAFGFECPDAIGWTPRGHSILVECKTSVADYLADLRKPFRQGAASLGRERWYLTGPAILAGRELPKGWGWLEVRNGRVFRLLDAIPRSVGEDIHVEIQLLVALARRAPWPPGKGVSIGEAGLESLDVEGGAL